MKIEVTGLHYTYPATQLEAHKVLAIDAWGIESGSHILLRGISGSGKTTLLNVLAGLLPPAAGAVQLDDTLLYALSEARRDRFRAANIGYVFQTHLLVPVLNVLENVMMPLIFAGQSRRAEQGRLAHDMLARVGLAAFARHYPKQLSTGQRLRVAVARALVSSPRLVLADEPTAALDPHNADAVMDLLHSQCRLSGATLLVASHDPAVEWRFDRVCTLAAGRLADAPTAGRTHSPAACAVPSQPLADARWAPALATDAAMLVVQL
jgi:putative ABC transport system ATP-binding protein